MRKSLIGRLMAIPKNVNASRKAQELEANSNPYLMQAMRDNKRQGQFLAVQARWFALAAISVLIMFINPNWEAIYYEVLLLAFALLGWAQLKASEVGQSRRELFLILFDLALLAVIVVVPNPFTTQDWPTAMQYRFDNFSYFYVILAGAALAYSWRTLLSIGTITFSLWMIGLVAVSYLGKINLPVAGKIKEIVGDSGMFYFVDPNNVMFSLRVQEVVIFMIVAMILALNGWRANQMLLKQASALRERENLARHFPPNIVDELAGEDHPFASIRSQPVAVLFADIVGFTRMAEHGDPERVVGMLREYHKRLETAVFENRGTLDKFLGDGIMATFGSPVISPQDASNAIQCALDMVTTVDQWNKERERKGEAPVNLSIGIHYGDVILGDIGSERRLEFATLGDTVNVAARLEELTRKLGTKVILSDALIAANKQNKASNDNRALENYSQAGRQLLRGRDSDIGIWTMNS